MGVIGEQRAKARGEFISYREVIEKLVAETKDSLADWAEELRAKEIHFTGGRRYIPGRIIDGGYEEEPLGSLLEQTAEAGEIPAAYDMFHKWGPDNVGWLRVKLVENLKAAGLPAPDSLLESSPEYAPRCPLPAPAEEDTNQYPTAPLAVDEQRPETQAAEITNPRPAPAPLPGVVKGRIIGAFEPPGSYTSETWERALGDAKRIEWLRPARVFAGARGTSALWNPAKVAMCICDQYAATPQQRREYGRIIRQHFRDWLPEWQEYDDPFS